MRETLCFKSHARPFAYLVFPYWDGCNNFHMLCEAFCIYICIRILQSAMRHLLFTLDLPIGMAVTISICYVRPFASTFAYGSRNSIYHPLLQDYICTAGLFFNSVAILAAAFLSCFSLQPPSWLQELKINMQKH